MYALIQDNEIIQTAKNPRVFFPNISFPAAGPNQQFLAENGVKYVVSSERKDERFYYVSSGQPPIQLVNGVPTWIYVNTPKALEDVTEIPEGQEEEVTTPGLKSQWIAQVKENANRALAPTDWYVIRKAERDVAIPEEVVAERAAIVAECTAKEAAIAAATTIEELKEVLFPMPVPDYLVQSGNTD